MRQLHSISARPNSYKDLRRTTMANSSLHTLSVIKPARHKIGLVIELGSEFNFTLVPPTHPSTLKVAYHSSRRVVTVSNGSGDLTC